MVSVAWRSRLPRLRSDKASATIGSRRDYSSSSMTDEKLAQEAARYGDAGPRPQVVWPNGVLASTAVGLAVDLVTDWTRRRRTHAYLVYDGNAATVKESVTLRGLENTSRPHFSGARDR
jgi:hypothetical protein